MSEALSLGGELRLFLMPYCIKRAGPSYWILLNRRYKPLGQQSNDWVEYETHFSRVKLKGLTRKVAEKLSYCELKESGVPETVFLYADSCVPTRSKAFMNAYLQRLAVLAKLKVQR